MGRTIKTKIRIEDIYFDEELYPRSNVNWQTSYIYSDAMKTGIKFPPIVIAKFNNKNYLVDGKHRIEANKLLKKETIDAIVYTGWNKKKIFTEAVRLNVSHGKPLFPYEKRKIALKLMEFKFSQKEISNIIQVSYDKLENFVESRLTNTITGSEVDTTGTEELTRQIGRVVLKTGLKHLAGQNFSEEDANRLESTQEELGSYSQIKVLKEIIHIIEIGMLDITDPEVKELVGELKNLLNGL